MPARHRRAVAVLLTGLAVALAACTVAPAGTASSSPMRSNAAGVAGEIVVYAAASLRGAFEDIATAFEAEHPDAEVTAVYDGSATLVTQILEGAPADVFASADEANMSKAGDLAPSPALFATNTLVIAVPAANPAGVTGLADLAEVATVLCAPEVPCGAASATLLRNAGVSVDAVSLEQNVTAVLTKVAAEEADAGLVYATDARGDDRVDAIVPDGADEVVNRYPIAALRDAARPDAAAAFVAFVLSDAGQAILAASGFGAP